MVPGHTVGAQQMFAGVKYLQSLWEVFFLPQCPFHRWGNRHKDTMLVVAKLGLVPAPDSQADPLPLPLTLYKALKHV